MGEERIQIFQHLNLKEINSNEARLDRNKVIIEDGDEFCDSISIESSLEDSTNSVDSSYSSDLVEDASSPTSDSSSSSSSSSSLTLSNGPLYELSELMVQLPIKRGLSKYYQGKSQSFTSLASVKNIEDLAKKGIPYRIKMKSCKSYGGGLDGHKLYSPKATISKKVSRGSFLSSLGKRVI